MSHIKTLKKICHNTTQHKTHTHTHAYVLRVYLLHNKTASSIYDSTYAWRDNIYSGKQAQTASFKDPVRTAL
jgi:hypothetical protein